MCITDCYTVVVVLLENYTRWTSAKTKKINEFFKDWINGGDVIPSKSESLASS